MRGVRYALFNTSSASIVQGRITLHILSIIPASWAPAKVGYVYARPMDG